MSQSPPIALLRLREHDIVRLCGLLMAGRGLDLAAHHAVTACRREGARLEATVAESGQSHAAWVELPGELTPTAMRWRCARDAADGAAPGNFGCAHVAAILSAWVRQPEDFATPATTEDAPIPDTPTPATADSATPERPPPHQPAISPAPPASRQRAGASLADELRRLPTNELLAIARRVLDNEPAEDISPEDAPTAVASALADAVLLNALVARLDPAVGALLADLLLMGTATTSADLEALAHRSGRPPSALRAEVAVLERHGLLFRAASAAHPEGPREWKRLTGWRMPPEIRASLAPRLPIEPLPTAQEGAPPAQPRPDASVPTQSAHLRIERYAPIQLAQALALLARAPFPLNPLAPPPTERRPISVRPLAANTVALVAGDLPPERLAELARAAGLPAGLARMARRLLPLARARDPRHPLTDLAAAPAAERAAALRAGFRLWLAAEAPAELADLDLAPGGVRARYDPAHPAFRPAALADEAVQARAFVTRLIALARPGAWYTLDALLDLVWRVQPFFLRGRQRTYATPAWWLESPAGRALRPAIREEWLLGEGTYLRHMLRGPLSWWSVVDLASDATGQPRAFRLTRFGAFLLGFTETAEPLESTTAPHAAPILLPMRDGAVAVEPLGAGAPLLDALAAWARPSSVAGGRLIYVPSADLAAAAFDRDERPDALLARLRAIGGAGSARAADALAARLDAWCARYGASHLSDGQTLLEASDEATLAEALAAAPDLAARVHRLSPAAVLLPPADAAQLRAILARRGYGI